MPSITDNVSAQFLQDLINDIYQVVAGVGNEWVSENIVYTTFGVPGSRGLSSIKSTNNPLGPNSATPRAGDAGIATFDLNQRVITSIARMARIEINPDDFIGTFEELRSNGLLNALQLDPELRAAILESFEEAVTDSVSQTMSLGVGGDLTAQSFDWLVGFFELITTDVSTNRVIFGANPVIDKTNVFDIMETMIQDLPARLDKKLRNTTFTMNLNTFKILQEANRTEGNTGLTRLQLGDFPDLAGYEMKTVSTLPDDFIILTPTGNDKKSNLVMSAWVSGDEKNFNVYKESEGDQLFQGILRFQAGVQLRDGGDTLWYADASVI